MKLLGLWQPLWLTSQKRPEFLERRRKMTQETTAQERAPKSRLVEIVRWIFMGAVMLVLLFVVVMAVYRKFAG
jgi:ABC-type Fe3+ transport system permease subunit